MMAKYGLVRAIVVACVCLSGMSASMGLAQTVKVHVSSNAGDRLSAKPDVQFSEVATPKTRLLKRRLRSIML